MSRLRWTALILFACGTFAAAAFLVVATAEADAKHCETTACLRKANAWLRHDRNHLRGLLARARGGYTPSYAIRLAAAAFGIPERDMRTIAECESHLGAQKYAEAGSGASGLFQFLGSTWRRTPFAGFDVFDPVANALAAAQLVVRDHGWHEWSCSSITGVH